MLSEIQNNNFKFTFSELISYIDANYHFEATAFKNGELLNEIGQNNGSCKVFQFAILNDLSKEQSLACFAEHYKAVIADPSGESHQNIRNFMRFGFEGLVFEKITLLIK